MELKIIALNFVYAAPVLMFGSSPLHVLTSSTRRIAANLARMDEEGRVVK